MDTSRGMNQPTAAEGLGSGHDPRPVVVLPSTAVPAPIAPLPPVSSGSQGHIAAPINPSHSFSSGSEAVDFVDLSATPNVLRVPARHGESMRWTAESVTTMLDAIQQLRVKYDNGAGGYRQGIWRFVKEKLEAAGYIRSTKQIQNKFAMMKKGWHERKTLLAISGFGIDPSTKQITASNECWENLKVSNSFRT